MASISEWSNKICAAWQRSVTSIFEVGQLLIEAKAALPHGAFEKMVQHELPFGERTAQCLMAIARDRRLRTLAKATPASLLPPSWTILHRLTQLNDKQFNALLQAGIINAEMARADIPSALLDADNIRVIRNEPVRHTVVARVTYPEPSPPQGISVKIRKQSLSENNEKAVANAIIEEATRLIAALCNANALVREKAVELLENRDDRAIVVEAVADLARLLR